MTLFVGIEHFAIASRSPEALAHWYVRELGFKIHTTFDNGAGKPFTYFIRLGDSGPFLELFAADREKSGREKPNSEPGLAHVAILVSDFEQAVAKMANSGARPEGELRTGPSGFRIQFYRDPEGNLFHILHRTNPLPKGGAL